MTSRPLILITNDDGVNSPGLHAVIEAVADLGELLVMAPTFQQTGASRSYPTKVDHTVQTVTLSLNGGDLTAYTAAVSPAQSVALAVRELAQRPIDLCISGINYGENVGSGTTISGTVGAAMEAASFRIPALAVSLETPHQYHLSYSTEIDFIVAGRFTRFFARETLAKGLPPRVDLLKIDVPAAATPETGWRIAAMSRQRYYQPAPDEKDREDKSRSFNYRVHIDPATLEPGSDIHTLAMERLVAVVPVTIDVTAPVVLPDVARFFNETS